MSLDSKLALTVDFLKEFIEAYRSHPSLWRVGSKDYVDKTLKKAGYDDLINKCWEFNIAADREFVVRKINSLRGAFRKEHNKVLAAAAKGEKYFPVLWYYRLLLFTSDKEPPDSKWKLDSSEYQQDDFSVESPEEGYGDNIKIEAVYNVKEQGSVDENREKKQDSEQEETMPEDLAEPMLQDHLQVQSFSKDQIMRTSRLYCRPSPYLTHKRESETERFGDEFTAIGTSVGAKLKRMSETQRNYAEMLMAQVLGMGLLGKLNESTTLCLNKSDLSTNEVQNSDAEKNDDNEK